MSGQSSPVLKRSGRFGPRRSVLGTWLATATCPAGLRLRGSLHRYGPTLAGDGCEGRCAEVITLRAYPISLPVDEIVARYTDDGVPSCELARQYGVSVRTIIRRLGAAGVNLRARKNSRCRKRGGPLHENNSGYLATIDRAGRECRIHRGCWEAHHGPIPRGHVIHHIDEDRQHNEIENLACMPSGEHTRLHWT